MFNSKYRCLTDIYNVCQGFVERAGLWAQLLNALIRQKYCKFGLCVKRSICIHMQMQPLHMTVHMFHSISTTTLAVAP